MAMRFLSRAVIHADDVATCVTRQGGHGTRSAIAVAVLVTAWVGYGSISAADPPDRIWVVAPGRIRVIPEVSTWRFEVCALALERPSRAIVISELRCGSYDLLGALPTSDLAVQVPAAVVRGAYPTSIDRWIAHSSDFSDGHKTLTELATLLRDSGYKIGYITDHSDGVAAKGWSGRQRLTTYSITIQPGHRLRGLPIPREARAGVTGLSCAIGALS
jgi:hypothetical protein